MDVKTDRIALALKTVPMFSGLKPEEIAMVASLGMLAEHDGGDYLWRAGDESTYLTVLLRGRVKVVKGTPDGGSMILEIFGAGEPVGALVMYNYMPYPADALCMEPVTLFKIHRRDFFDMLDHNPEIARGLIRELTRIVLTLTRKMEEMRGTRVESRIARLFLMFARRTGKHDKSGTYIPGALNRQEVADLVGTTVESAIRTLSRWGRSGLVRTDTDGFFIPDIEALERVAEGEDET